MVKIKEISITKNFIFNILLVCSNVIYPLIIFPYTSRVLQVEAIGKFIFATTVLEYFLMFASLGIPTYGIRICAQVKDNKNNLSKTVHELLILNTLITSFIFIIFMAAIFFIPEFTQIKGLLFVNSSALLWNLVGVNWLFSGVEDYKFISSRSIAFKLISLIFLFSFVKEPEDLYIYAAINIFALYGSNILSIFYSKKYVSFINYKSYELKKHLRPVLIFFATSIAISIYSKLDILMIGFMKGNMEVGYYSVALKIRFALATFVTVLGTVLLPRLSYYVKKKENLKFKELYIKSMGFTTLIALPLIVYFFIFAKESVILLSGSEFSQATSILRFLLPTVLIAGISNVTGTQYLVPWEKEKIVLKSVVFGAIFDFILNILFIPAGGADGAAISTLLTEILVLAVQICYMKDYFYDVVSRIELRKTIFSSLIAVAATYILSKYLHISLFFYLLITSSVFFIIYLGCLLLTKNIFILEAVKYAAGRLGFTKYES